MAKPKSSAPPQPNLFGLLGRYTQYSVLLVLFTILANALSLLVPTLIASGIDSFTTTQQISESILIQFILVVAGIFGFTFAQNIMQTLTSERIARDLRKDLSAKISRQHNATIDKLTSSVLLTNLTSDIDAVKSFIAQAVPGLISSALLIVGTSILLLLTDWKLALVVLLIIPIIGITFGVIFGKVGKLFIKAQQVIDWLNKVINESILGSGLIRILNSQHRENEKFADANKAALDTGLQILSYFASLIPIISFTASMAVLAILVLGGHFVIIGEMSLGSFTAFNSYVGILIFPIIMMGFMSNVIARSTASYVRIMEVMNTADPVEKGTLTAEDLKGNISVKNVSLTLGEKTVLKNATFSIKAGSRTAIIGPTAAGKTQLLSLLVGLTQPTSGTISYDGKAIEEYDRTALFRKIGLVFQESVIFQVTIRENIAFSEGVSDADLQKAIETAELKSYIENLPQGLDTVVTERGTSLSGGQKQRVMLARALALQPTVLLLDDFTARVDLKTEKKILENVEKNYPGVTLISITQKISSIKEYDKILVLMEGEVVAQGTHEELLKKSPEYVQLYESQKSTSNYEVSAE